MKLNLVATREGRTMHMENLIGGPEETDQRGHVARLRREHGFPLPAPDWESVDDEGTVLICHADDVPVGSVRLVRRPAGDGDWCPYLTPELRAVLPGDPAGFVFCERLVIAPGARSLEALAIVIHGAAVWSAVLWPVAEFAAITRPDLVPLADLLGARQLSEAMVLPGSDGLGLLIGGRLDEAATRTREMFTAGGWRVSGPIPVPTRPSRTPFSPSHRDDTT